ncbi:MAG: hypothetical protein H7X92_06755 [Chitinophagales bacterium]|nr:hypothetical protein [Hyphomicrobiales bacterium]
MQDLFESGRMIDIILALVLAEAIGLWLYHRMTGRGVALSNVGLNLVSGFCLMLALRAALVDAWWGWISLWLIAALVVHAADLVRQWRGSH